MSKKLSTSESLEYAMIIFSWAALTRMLMMLATFSFFMISFWNSEMSILSTCFGSSFPQIFASIMYVRTAS